MTHPSPAAFLLGVVLAAAISAGVFHHASRHGSRRATAWGVAAFLFAGITVPVYFVRYWIRRRPRAKDGSDAQSDSEGAREPEEPGE